MTGNDARGEVLEITPLELKARLDQGQPLTLLDVREPFEREVADLPEVGQIRIPLRELHAHVSELDPDETFVLYCRSGARSHRAVEQLMEGGFSRVYNLVGGLLAWADDVDPSLRRY